MKTLCVMDWVSRTNGGIFEAERRLQQLLRTKMGISIEVVGLRDAKTDADLPAWLPLVPTACAVRGPAAVGYAPEFSRALTNSHADLAYVAGLWKYPMMAAQRWSRAARKPLVIAPHGMLEPWAVRHSGLKKKFAGWFFQNAQLRDAACLRALCLPEVDSFRAYGLKNPIAVVPNGVDLPSLAEVPMRHARFPEGRKVLLYLGRIHDKKGLAQLLAGWAQARDAAGDWILAIAGWDQGGHEAELKLRARELGIAEVLFLGPQFGADKDACYASCDARRGQGRLLRLVRRVRSPVVQRGAPDGRARGLGAGQAGAHDVRLQFARGLRRRCGPADRARRRHHRPRPARAL